MSELRIADDLALPLVIHQGGDEIALANTRFLVVGGTGTGKTNAAVRITEGLIQNGQQVVLFDPLDVGKGLLWTPDGSASSLPILVFGGPYGHRPLTPEMALPLADLIVEQRLSAVLSMRHLDEEEMLEFMATFTRRVYRRKGEPGLNTPCLFIYDEADIAAPQQMDLKGQRATLRALSDMARRGRVAGIGVMALTQRLANLAVPVRSQTQTYLLLGVTDPRDREAVRQLLGAHPNEEERQEVLASLPYLQPGEAWVWSPALLGHFGRHQLYRRETMDTSKAPPPSGQSALPTAAALDLAMLDGYLEAAIEKVAGDDPEALRRRIAELEGLLAEGGRVEVREVEKIVEVRVPVFQRADLDAFQSGIQEVLAVAARLAEVGETFEENVQEALRVVEQPPRIETPPTPSAPRSSVVGRQASVVEVQEQTALTDGAQGLLNVLIERHPLTLTHNQWAGMAERGNKSSSLHTHKRELQQAGLVEERSGLYALTKQAVNLFEHRLATNTSAPLVEVWRRVLDGGPRKMFDVLVDADGGWVERDDLARRSGFSPTSSSVGVHLKVLRDNDLADAQGKRVRLKPGIL